jgi:hypothetical protein
MAIERDANNETIPGTVFNARQVRILKVFVIGMGLLLVVGFALVVTVIVYQATRIGESEPAGPSAQAVANRAGGLALSVPSGTKIESLTLDGKRMAVQLTGPNGAEIAVIDVDKGRVISRIRLEPK